MQSSHLSINTSSPPSHNQVLKGVIRSLLPIIRKRLRLNNLQGAADNPRNLYMQSQKIQVSLQKSSKTSQVFSFQEEVIAERRNTVLKSQEILDLQ